MLFVIDGGISRLRVYGLRVPDVVQTGEIEVAEEKVVENVDELKIIETSEKVAPLTEAALSSSLAKTNETLVESEVELKSSEKIVLTSEVSSVTTLIGEEMTTESAKKSPAKRGRPKGTVAGTAAAVVAAGKLAPKKKAKGRSASVLDDDETTDASETVASTPPRNKRARE